MVNDAGLGRRCFGNFVYLAKAINRSKHWYVYGREDIRSRAIGMFGV